jgi:hypothetical protein
MSDPIDTIKLVHELPKRPRGRACIVLTHEYLGQKSWASEISKQTKMSHLDLLDFFAKNDELSSKISSFSIKDFFSFLQAKKDTPVLIITGLEFLMATWIALANLAEQFCSHVETWNKSPALLLILQHISAIAESKFLRHPDKIFVIDQKNTLALS